MDSFAGQQQFLLQSSGYKTHLKESGIFALTFSSGKKVLILKIGRQFATGIL